DEPEVVDAEGDAAQEAADEQLHEQLTTGGVVIGREVAAVERRPRMRHEELVEPHLEPREVDAEGDAGEDGADAVLAEETAAVADEVEAADLLAVLEDAHLRVDRLLQLAHEPRHIDVERDAAEQRADEDGDEHVAARPVVLELILGAILGGGDRVVRVITD